MIENQSSVTSQPYIYNAYAYPWQSPISTLDAYSKLQKVYGQNLSRGEFKNVREGINVAILLLGLYKAQQIPYFMQRYREGSSPDYITLRQIPSDQQPILGEFQEVEVVTFGPYSKESTVEEFLAKSKFSRRKSYDSKTIILCEIQKNYLIDHKKINTSFKGINPPCEIFFLGKTSPDEHIYEIFRGWPDVDYREEVNILEIQKYYPAPNDVIFNLSIEKKIKYTPANISRPNEYEIFDLEKEKLEKFIIHSST